jgi:hypothetical protein
MSTGKAYHHALPRLRFTLARRSPAAVVAISKAHVHGCCAEARGPLGDAAVELVQPDSHDACMAAATAFDCVLTQYKHNMTMTSR